MSTSTNNQSDLVTLPLDPQIIQKLLLAQAVMSQQKQGSQGTSQTAGNGTHQANSAQNSLPKGQSQQTKTPLPQQQQQQQSKPLIRPITTQNPITRNPLTAGGVNKTMNPISKPFNAQIRPQTQNKGGSQENSNPNPNEEKKPQQDQTKQTLELLQKLVQSQGGQNIGLLSTLITQLTGNQGGSDNNDDSNNGQRNNSRGNFAYSSANGIPQRGGFGGGRGRGGFNNNRGGGNNFRGRGGSDNGGFNRQNRFQGGENRFQARGNRDFSDPSRSRSRDKSNPRFGGQGNFQNDGNNGGRPQNTRKGDWTCPQCNNSNYAVRTHCNRCQVEKPAELVQQDEERKTNAPEFKKGDWHCPSCKNLNFAKRDKCNRCGIERPEETLLDYKPSKKNNFNNNNNNNGDDDWNNTNSFKNDNNNYDFGAEIQDQGGNQEMEEGEVHEWH